jgi:hypothetical protein
MNIFLKATAAAAVLAGALMAQGGRPVQSPESRLKGWKPVEMPYRAEGLSEREKQTVEKLVEASRWLDRGYWRQSDPEGIELYRTAKTPALRAMFSIMGGRWDQLDENRPFAGSEPMPPGRGLYPRDLTAAELEKYAAAHPGERAALYSPFTVVKRHGGRLAAVPYHEEYKAEIGPMAKALDEAAALTPDAAFAKFLRLRAAALRNDDYFQSDLAWLDLVDPKIDVIFAPYETYLDELAGVKTSYGAAVLIRDEKESRRLAAYQKYVPEIQDALPLEPADRPSKRGHASPMLVADAPYRAGDLRYGYQAVADNLPNDPRVHQQKGSKKIFFKNFMDARVEHVILPVAGVMLEPGDARRVSAEGYLAGTLLHEISHGLGPAFARQGGRQVDIREAIGPVYSTLEEAKADVTGLFGLGWLAKHGGLSGLTLEDCYASHVGGIFRTLRFGAGEAHSRAEMMEFNYFSERGVLALVDRLREVPGGGGGPYERVAGDGGDGRPRAG